jgi:hypothetical protein
MNIEKIKKDWNHYAKETEENDFVDIDLHFSMAMEVGGLVKEIERLKEYVAHIEHENNLLYGRLNNIVAFASKEVK